MLSLYSCELRCKLTSSVYGGCSLSGSLNTTEQILDFIWKKRHFCISGKMRCPSVVGCTFIIFSYPHFWINNWLTSCYPTNKWFRFSILKSVTATAGKILRDFLCGIGIILEQINSVGSTKSVQKFKPLQGASVQNICLLKYLLILYSNREIIFAVHCVNL